MKPTGKLHMFFGKYPHMKVGEVRVIHRDWYWLSRSQEQIANTGLGILHYDNNEVYWLFHKSLYWEKR